MACGRGPIDARRARGEALVEEDAARETSRAGVAALKKRDAYQYGYGSGKLAAEEELTRWPGVPSCSLRLPDVIGPRDNLGGFLDLYLCRADTPRDGSRRRRGGDVDIPL